MSKKIKSIKLYAKLKPLSSWGMSCFDIQYILYIQHGLLLTRLQNSITSQIHTHRLGLKPSMQFIDTRYRWLGGFESEFVFLGKTCQQLDRHEDRHSFLQEEI